jgi:hypothetical protein
MSHVCFVCRLSSVQGSVSVTDVSARYSYMTALAVFEVQLHNVDAGVARAASRALKAAAEVVNEELEFQALGSVAYRAAADGYNGGIQLRGTGFCVCD